MNCLISQFPPLQRTSRILSPPSPSAVAPRGRRVSILIAKAGVGARTRRKDRSGSSVLGWGAPQVLEHQGTGGKLENSTENLVFDLDFER